MLFLLVTCYCQSQRLDIYKRRRGIYYAKYVGGDGRWGKMKIASKIG